MAVKGAIRIETRVTQGDENGVYRITEGKQGYLMLAFEEQDEARVVAKGIAKLLGVSYIDHLYTEQKQLVSTLGHMNTSGATTHRSSATTSNKSNTPKQLSTMIDVSRPEGAVRPKAKKVMGALKFCQDGFATGKSEAEIMEALIGMYIHAGQKDDRAKKLATEVLQAAKKQGN